MNSNPFVTESDIGNPNASPLSIASPVAHPGGHPDELQKITSQFRDPVIKSLEETFRYASLVSISLKGK